MYCLMDCSNKDSYCGANLVGVFFVSLNAGAIFGVDGGSEAAVEVGMDPAALGVGVIGAATGAVLGCCGCGLLAS